MSDPDTCDDCGIPIARHGDDCGYYADMEYGNPEWGRPLGWADASGRLLPADDAMTARSCRLCGRGLRLTAAYDLDGGAGRCWLYQCAADGCGAEHVWLPSRGLHRLPPREQDDTEIHGKPIPLADAGDPLAGRPQEAAR